MRINAAVAVLLLPLACEPAASPEASKPSAPVAVFPKPQDLAALPSLPAPTEAFGLGSVPVDSWSSLAAPAAQDDPSGYEDGSPWGGFARTLAAAHADRLRLSPALRCAATEIARFQLEKGGLPSESLRRFLAARCGSTSPDPLPVVSTLDAPEAATDQAIFEHTQAAVRDMLEKELGAGHHGIGVAAFRKGRRVAIAAVLGLDEVRFDTLSRTVDASRRTVVRGTMLAPAGQALAIINRGDYATALCEPDLAVKLPDFAFSCELAPGDHAAWLQIMVRQEGRAMSTSVADLLVCDGDPATLEYRARVVGPPSPVADGAALSAALVEGINRVRREARFPALSVAPGQSTENARLAGTLIDASVGRRTQDADVIALGLVAGWNVDGMIREGSLFMGLIAPTLDATALLGFAVERPFGRTVLLDPQARRIAVGPVVPPGGAQALGAVITTYRLFESPDHTADAARMLQRIAASRAAHGKAALSVVDAAPDLSERAGLVLAGQEEPMAALNVAMRSLSQRLSASVRGYVAEASELEMVPIPDELLRVPKGTVAVTVTHHKVKGAAWGQYVVFYLVITKTEASWL